MKTLKVKSKEEYTFEDYIGEVCFKIMACAMDSELCKEYGYIPNVRCPKTDNFDEFEVVIDFKKQVE